MSRMKSQRSRDEQTLTIATTLAIVVGTCAAGLAVLGVLDGLTDAPPVYDAVFPWILGAALLAGAVHLVRQRR